jgi:hypothetical protein
MQILIGYLVALSVFLGGGYAGVQWLLAPDEPAALAENSRAGSASTSRAINAKKLREARALHRKVAESLAEDAVRPAPARNQSDVAVAAGEDGSAKIADRSDARAVADASTNAASPQVPDATVAANDPKLNAKAEVSPVIKPEKIKAVQNESEAQQSRAGKPERESVVARKSVETKPKPAAPHSEAPIIKRQAAEKKKPAERFASSSRKPIMMILRTIEFPDGRREQRLLPMSQARSGLTRYGSVSAFAGDDDF